MNNEVFINIYSQIQMFWKPMMLGCYLIGFIFIFISAYKLAYSNIRNGDGRGEAILLGLVGLFLANIGWFLDILTVSVFGNEFVGSFTVGNGFRADVKGDAQARTILLFIVGSIKCIGFFGIVRGFSMLFSDGRKMNHGGSKFGAFAHIIGGVLGLNFELFAKTIAVSVGGDVGQLFLKYF